MLGSSSKLGVATTKSGEAEASLAYPTPTATRKHLGGLYQLRKQPLSVYRSRELLLQTGLDPTSKGA
jgi:hypothetical protein